MPQMFFLSPASRAGKPADKGVSYRPISLLSPAVKILERLLLPSLTAAFQLADHQHGFRRHRSTTTALLPLVDHVARGIRQPKPHRRSVAVAIDISKETLLITYKSLLRTQFDYAAPVWFANVKKTPIEGLQRIQNAGLRLVTGCHRISSPFHLHSEAKELPVADHLHMLSSQFLARALRENHPSHDVVRAPSGPRNKKSTLKSAFFDDIADLLTDGLTPPGEYKTIKDNIHTRAVSEYMQGRPNNPVIGRAPPPIHPSESRISRPYRAALAQLRSGHCIRLRAFAHRIGQAADGLCPRCKDADEDVAHLFDCPEAPTPLTPISLWLYPIEAAKFLARHPSFSDLPPPLPPPPPEPPPLSPVFSPLDFPSSFFSSFSDLSISSNDE